MFTLERVPGSETHFMPIDIGNGMKASIQASHYHYCSPRMNLHSSDEYETFEVALLYNDKWFHPEKDERFSNCTWAEYWNEYDDVAAGVPREEIVQMISDLRLAYNT
jgi:hypothetical protein